MKQIASTMAGTVMHIWVKPGDTVQTGQDVLVIESMKMEIPVTSEVSGVVKEILVREGDFVNEGDPVITLEQ
ncbi:MAG: acetyl-CoA carboxylase biotin carboxyl carrier protein subunit [Alicyclobacillaceae bacterium]|nr:acetyl-CoA carboxylase biotin carboxyl carrier protein subunit [Alicyclobacillaceae bacterium]